jgi:hypothetical protein
MWMKHPKIAEAWAHGKSSVTGKKERKFMSRSTHGSGAFSDEDMKKGYRCEPIMGS